MEVEINDQKIFAPLLDKWLVLKPEEMVRQEYICRLVNNYGFALEQMAQEVQVSNSQRGQGRAMADIVVWKNVADRQESNSPIIVVECKAEHITVREEDYFQGYNYASWAGADFFVTSNIKETRVFKVLKGKIPKKLEEVVNIPDAATARDDKKVNELLKQTKAFTRDEFSKLLFKCHNIIRNNDKLSPEAAFDEISKVLFMKIRYERNPDEDNIFTKAQFLKKQAEYEKNVRPVNIKLHGPNANIPYMDYWFELTKAEFKDDDLFDENEKIRIRPNSFEAIVKELQIYNLSTTSDDVKGIAFEKFLGRTFRGELGQFFTPRTIVDFMVDVLDPLEGEIVCDPCCGSGGFLIKAFEYVRSKIEEDIHQAKEKIKAEHFNTVYEAMNEKQKAKVDEKVNDLFSILNWELDMNRENSRIRRLSFDCIYGTDANPRMSRTAKMNMIMHGDGHGGVHHNDGLLNVNGVFEGRFDVILTNPPFGSRIEKSLKITEADKYKDLARIEKYTERYGPLYAKAMGQINDNIGESLLSMYKVGKLSTLTEVLFIERCLNLLKPGGRMGIVLPEGVLNNTNLQRVRDFVESKAKIIFITSIPQDVFVASGATVKPSLLFFKKFTQDEAAEYAAIVKRTTKVVAAKYAPEVNPLKTKLALRGKEAPSATEKKELKRQLKTLEDKMAAEIKAGVKEQFDYEIPIAEVQKAGISTTGAVIENELEPLAVEFKKYRTEKKLWKNGLETVTYNVQGDHIMRIGMASEPEALYNSMAIR